MKILNKSCATSVAAGCLIIGMNAQAANLFSDSFDTGIDGPLASQSLAGQSGPVAPVAWASPSGTQRIVNNQWALDGSASYAGLGYVNHSFTDSAITAAGGFTLSFDLYVSSQQVGGNWTSIAFGEGLSHISAANGFDFATPSTGTDFGLLIQNNGATQIFQHGSGLGAQGTATMNYDATPNHVVLSVLTGSFASGAAWDVSLTVNGSAIDLNGANPGTDYANTWDADGENYIAIGTSSWTSSQGAVNVDNFAVAVPEPSITALAGIGLFGLMLWRRRHNS